MADLKSRVAALERTRQPERRGALPVVVEDSTPDEVMERLRQQGQQVFRYSAFLDLLV